ncbi:MAG: DUF6448 family protein [Micropepsaceae bacterium]
MSIPHILSTSFTVFVVALHLALLIGASNPAMAHHNTLDDPVIKITHQALDAGNVNLLLIWVRNHGDGEIKSVFRKAVAFRKPSYATKVLADYDFFRTLVRVHRQGAGGAHTGLKPAGKTLGPAIPAGDKAFESGTVLPVVCPERATTCAHSDQSLQASTSRPFRTKAVGWRSRRCLI